MLINLSLRSTPLVFVDITIEMERRKVAGHIFIDYLSKLFGFRFQKNLNTKLRFKWFHFTFEHSNVTGNLREL